MLEIKIFSGNQVADGVAIMSKYNLYEKTYYQSAYYKLIAYNAFVGDIEKMAIAFIEDIPVGVATKTSIMWYCTNYQCYVPSNMRRQGIGSQLVNVLKGSSDFIINAQFPTGFPKKNTDAGVS